MELDCKCYEPLVEVKSIVGTLVENIYNDEAYQNYLHDLSDKEEKKADNIKATFSNIRVYNTNSDPLFLARDIGVLTNVTNINATIKNYNSEERVTGYYHDGNNYTKKEFLTRHGVYRLLFNSRTKLSEVFRGFMYRLIDHMMCSEVDKLRRIINDFTKDNPELVKESIVELNDNVSKYKQLCEIETTRRKQLELLVEKEQIEKQIIEQEKMQIEISESFNKMYIAQIKREQLVNQPPPDDSVEIMVLKKRFMKEVNILLVDESTVDAIAAKSDASFAHFIKTYKNNFAMNVKMINRNIPLNEDEFLFLRVSFNKKEEDKCIAATEYLYDKPRFSEFVEILTNECDHFQTPGSKKTSNDNIYYTTITSMRIIARTLI